MFDYSIAVQQFITHKENFVNLRKAVILTMPLISNCLYPTYMYTFDYCFTLKQSDPIADFYISL